MPEGSMRYVLWFCIRTTDRQRSARSVEENGRTRTATFTADVFSGAFRAPAALGVAVKRLDGVEPVRPCCAPWALIMLPVVNGVEAANPWRMDDGVAPLVLGVGAQPLGRGLGASRAPSGVPEAKRTARLERELSISRNSPLV